MWEPTSAHLLCDHHNTGRLSCTPKSWDGEQFDKSREHVRMFGNGGLFDHELFLLHLRVDVV